ncbi:hypothetical protein BGZ58_005559, partial [Dissophora ornata]
ARSNDIITLELPRKEAEASIPHVLDTRVALEGSGRQQEPEPEEEEEVMEQGQVTVRRSEAESGESLPESRYNGLGKAIVGAPQKLELSRSWQPSAGNSDSAEEEIQVRRLCMKRSRVQVIGSESDQSSDEKKTDKSLKSRVQRDVKKGRKWRASLVPKRQRGQRNRSSDEAELSSQGSNLGPGVRRVTRGLSRHRTGRGEQSSDVSSGSDTTASDLDRTSSVSASEGYVESEGDSENDGHSESGSAMSSESESDARLSKKSGRIPDDMAVAPQDGQISFMRCRYCGKLLDESIGHECTVH